VAMQQDRGKVAPFWAQHGFQFTTLLDSDGAISRRYKLRGLPTTYLIDCQGSIAAWARGPQEWTSEPMRALLASLFEDPNCG
jgi:peroxiredoxin